MSKKKPKMVLEYSNIPRGAAASGCSFCLLNLSLMLAAPAALVALIVKGARAK